MKIKFKTQLGFILALILPWKLSAQSGDQILGQYQKSLSAKELSFQGAVQAGKILYTKEVINKKGEKISCRSCHGLDPRKEGKSKANKVLKPLAPSANPERFTDLNKVEKWFSRNCNDVFNRECTTKEKVDFISYIISIK